jgi:hypothetical protein
VNSTEWYLLKTPRLGITDLDCKLFNVITFEPNIFTTLNK